jgi:hypothetical protein
MDRVVRRNRRAGAVAVLAITAALSTGALTLAAGSGVTFMNGSNHKVDIYLRYGGSSCEDASTVKKLAVDAGQSATADSGDSKVCYCLTVPERATCDGGWLQAASGSTRHLQ